MDVDRTGAAAPQPATREDLAEHLRRVEELLAAGTRRWEREVQGWQQAGVRESRWPVAAVVLVVAGLQVLLPDRYSIGLGYLLPAVEVALMAGILVVNWPRHPATPARVVASRRLGLLLATVMSTANLVSVVRLLRDLVHGSGVANNAAALLLVGGSIWLTNVTVFGLWYWELDRGGPAARAEGTARPPDFLFPQMTSPGVAPASWRPLFLDYLYTSFTNSTAFSPTDTMPLTLWSKGLMTLQSGISLVTVALVIARAINVLR